ncbi:MAG TPA: hypothetical protein VG276_05195 [Actinomycetes bacterium]|nr:hypothetical protein [Actinomycetes bacterium]
MRTTRTACVEIFLACCQAIDEGVLVRRVSAKDKEFHFQNWFEDRLEVSGVVYDRGKRNSYPDFTLVHPAEGYEVKGLGWPGREASYDSNSRIPTGLHNGRAIFYVFGRYPAVTSDAEYPVVDLVVSHGDFLNANHEYVHENKSFRGFGSYGDLLVRDRKMYVAPTPYALTTATTGQRTLIAPEGLVDDARLEEVGRLTRTEADTLIVGYSFDLTTNDLATRRVPNPSAGLDHPFVAYRRKGNGAKTQVTMSIPEHVQELPTEVTDE